MDEKVVLLEASLSDTQAELRDAIAQITQQRVQIEHQAKIPSVINVLDAGEMQMGFTSFEREVRAQTISNKIRSFDGLSAKRLSDFCMDIDRATLTVGEGGEIVRSLVLQNVTSHAGTFVYRFILENKDATWPQIKTAIKQRFSDLADTTLLGKYMRNIKQKKEESVQCFGERLERLSEEAYPDTDRTSDFFQMNLVQIFTDGLYNDGIARRIIRDGPHTLIRAISVASTEQTCIRSFNLRPSASARTEVPMEVDALHQRFQQGNHQQTIQSERKNKTDDKLDRLTTQMEKLTEMLSTTNPPRENWNQPRGNWSQPKGNWNRGRGKSTYMDTTKIVGKKQQPNAANKTTGQRLCFFCDKPGHFKADCFKWKRQQQQQGNGAGPQ